MKSFKILFVKLSFNFSISFRDIGGTRRIVRVGLFIAALLFAIGCKPIKEKSLQEINSDIEAKIKSQSDYFLNLKAGDFVQLNRILYHLSRMNEKEVLTRGVLIVTEEKVVISDRECPVSEGAPQLRELFIQKEGIKEMPSSGSYVEVSGDISSKSIGLHGMWPGSLKAKSIKIVKATAQDCVGL